MAFVEPDGGTNCEKSEKIQIMMDRDASLHSLHDGRRKEDAGGEKFLANNAAAPRTCERLTRLTVPVLVFRVAF